MGGSIIINVLVYTHNVGPPVTSLIYLKSNISDSLNNLFDFCTPSGGLFDFFLSFYTHTRELGS